MQNRKNNTMIACVTFDTVKITDPVGYYAPTRLYLIYDVRDNKPDNIFQEFFEEVSKIIKSKWEDSIEIIPKNEKVTDFNVMLKTVLEIIELEHKEENKREIYVNISAGSNEYAAAATVASMMNQNVVPFSVRSKEYTVKINDEVGHSVREIYYENSHPIGLTKAVFPQDNDMELQRINIDIPKEHLIRALRIMSELNDQKKYPKSGAMIKILKDKNLWIRNHITIDTDGSGNLITKDIEKEKKIKKRKTEAVYYQRDFINKWLEKNWIEKDDFGRYVLTDLGKITIKTFYTL